MKVYVVMWKLRSDGSDAVFSIWTARAAAEHERARLAPGLPGGLESLYIVEVEADTPREDIIEGP